MNLITVCLIFISLIPCAITAQPYPVGHRQLTLTDPARPGRNIGVEVYYPGTSAGENIAVANGAFPLLVLGHGFLMTWSAYQPYWEQLVPQGYILVLPTTEGGFSPSHSAFGADLSLIRAWFQTETNRTSSVWENHITPAAAVMGHSMGGGAAFLAMQADTAFTTLIGIAAAETNPSAIQSAAGILKPVLILAGRNDCVTPPAQHQQPMYDALASPSRCIITLQGGSHCQFAAANIFCNTGESTCQPPPAISEATQHTLTFQALLLWLSFYLKNDCISGPAFQQFISNTQGVTAQQSGVLACTGTTRSPQVNTPLFFISPNPSGGELSLYLTEHAHFNTLKIYDMTGRCRYIESIPKDRLVSRYILQVPDLPTAIYLIRIENAGGEYHEALWQKTQ